MKNLIVLLLALALFSCRSTNYVTLSVTEPAPVTLPASIKKVGTINRSLRSDRKPVLEQIDQVLSAEGKNLDRDGAHRAMIGLTEELKRNARFAEVRYLENEHVENSGSGVFPEPVSWEQIAEICKRNDLDGVVSLEFYDTDSRIDYGTAKVNVVNPLGLKIPAIEHHATANTVIKTGWRIYDYVNRTIIDEYIAAGKVNTTGKGINPVAAVSAITGRKEVVNQESFRIGRSYALSIVPYKTRVSRIYFVRGNDKFKLAKRKAQTGNWEGAAEIWLQETKNANPKIAGRAVYNMAIINEIDGDLEGAIASAQRAYENYGNKSALRYLNILKNRKGRVKRLEHQLQTEGSF